jgi:Pyruvate/2-oxoacid:ferredoxin oxidoreductase gamma subunit
MKGYITLILSSLFFISYSQVSVIHFNSEWNADNNYDISILKDCEKSDVVICHNPELQEKHNIFAVPTIIILDNNIEIARFEANIMMQLEATKKEIQNTIDQIYLAKFE